MPDATMVPTSAGYLSFAGTLPTSVVVVLKTAAVSVTLGPLHSPPSPAPSSLPSSVPTSSPTSAVAYPELSPATRYTVAFHDTSTPCAIFYSDAGSFTTR
jgi:hypothetical protein